jgi:hypothetical protein
MEVEHAFPEYLGHCSSAYFGVDGVKSKCDSCRGTSSVLLGVGRENCPSSRLKSERSFSRTIEVTLVKIIDFTYSDIHHLQLPTPL